MKQEAKLVRIDRSKPYLRQWYSQGFRAVKVKLADVSCRVCRSVADAEFYIMSLMQKDNPIFRLTHPNCRCGFIPIPESNVKHDKFNETTGYKLKAKELQEKPAKEEVDIHQDKNEDRTQHETDLKQKQVEKEIEKTEEKIKDAEDQDKPASFKQYLTKYLDQLKKFLGKLVP